MNIKRVTRLLLLLQKLQSGDGRNADGLAEECGVSRRTVFRDIESLRDAGVPIEYDEGVCKYRIDSSHFLPPTNLTLDEALWLLLAVDRASESGPPEITEAARLAASKIEASLPTAMRDELRSVASTLSVMTPPTNPLSGSGDAYKTLQQASFERRAVEITYRSHTEFEEIVTVLRPYQLLFYKRSWYAIGKSSLHGDVRTFNIGRVVSATLNSEEFSVPRAFSLREYLGNAWGIMSESGPDHDVCLKFDSLVARNVAEVSWHPTQQCEFLEDGTMEYRARVSGLNEIVWWILGYGDKVEVLSPPKLRKLVANRLRFAAAQYDA